MKETGPWSVAMPVFSSSSPPLSLHAPLSPQLSLPSATPPSSLSSLPPHFSFPLITISSSFPFPYLPLLLPPPSLSLPPFFSSFHLLSYPSSWFISSFSTLPLSPPSLFQSLPRHFFLAHRFFSFSADPLPVFQLVCFGFVWFDLTMTPRGQNFPEFFLINRHFYLMSSLAWRRRRSVT